MSVTTYGIAANRAGSFSARPLFSARPISLRRWTAIFAVLASSLFSLLLLFGNMLVPLLESRFERVGAEAIQSASGMIVLGGAGDIRIREAGQLARRFPHLLIVLTGTGFSKDELVEILGDNINPTRLRFEEQAQNTHENALYTRGLLADRSNERWLLVTSASHMPRAMGAFRRQKLAVMPWPVADTPDDWDARNRIAFHEWVGMFAYRLRDRSTEVFPAPQSAPIDFNLIRTSTVTQE